MASIDEEMKDVAAKVKKATIKGTKLIHLRVAALEQKNRLEDAIQDVRSDKRREEERRDAQAERTAHFTAQANQIAARVPINTGETAESLDKKLAKLSEDLKRFERE